MQDSRKTPVEDDWDTSENQSRFALALLEATTDAIVGVTVDQKIFMFNPAAEEIFGYPRHEILGQPLDLLVDPKVRNAHRNFVHQFLASGETARFMANREEIRGQRKSGEVFPAAATIMRLELTEGVFLVATLTDLSRIKETERRWKWVAQLLDCSPDFVAAADANGIPFYHNEGARALLGLDSQDDFSDWRISSAHPEWAARRVLEEGLPAAADYGHWQGETALKHKSGHEIPVSQLIVAKRDDQGEVEGYATFARDLRPFKQITQRLDGLTSALDQSTDLVWIADAEGRLIYANAAMERVSGYCCVSRFGRPAADVFREIGADLDYVNQLAGRCREASPSGGVYSFRCADGRRVHLDETVSVVYDERGQPVFCVSVGRDISERLELQDRLRDLAYHDQLTGLPNRYLFYDHLAHGIERAGRAGTGLAVLFIDLDGFKQINDNHGHTVGDAVLQQVARRLASTVRQPDTLARLGGDEFLLLMEDIPRSERENAELLQGAAERIVRVLEQPIQTEDGLRFQLRASTGISIYPTDATSGEDLVRYADLAMYQAKAESLGGCRFSSPALAARASERLYMEQELREALERRIEDWDVMYQPIVDLSSGDPLYVEALARWNHPREGLIGPDRFIPVAEQTGLIKPLGLRVLVTACRQLAEWRASGLPVERVSVNVSARQLANGAFVDEVQRILAETELPPESLQLEVTETMAAEAYPVDLDALVSLGVRIAIDDFGTGFSTLVSVKELPAEVLKVDRAFVRDLATSEDSAAIVHATLAMAKSFGYEVVAEGIETDAELETLRQWECHFGQGFLFARPVWPTEIPDIFS